MLEGSPGIAFVTLCLVSWIAQLFLEWQVYAADHGSLARLREAAASCTRCPLYANATQTVFGEGRSGGIMLVDEQPGDQEDRAGKPFVGPAGRLLRELLEEAGIDVEQVYATNAVKHFRWRPRGTRCIHDKPSRSEVTACGYWLALELETVRPAVRRTGTRCVPACSRT